MTQGPGPCRQPQSGSPCVHVGHTGMSLPSYLAGSVFWQLRTKGKVGSRSQPSPKTSLGSNFLGSASLKWPLRAPHFPVPPQKEEELGNVRRKREVCTWGLCTCACLCVHKYLNTGGWESQASSRTQRPSHQIPRAQDAGSGTDPNGQEGCKGTYAPQPSHREPHRPDLSMSTKPPPCF